MYELINNQLLKVETVQTERQTAIVKTGFTTVYGNVYDEELVFDAIPEKQEIEGKIAELHFDTETKSLKWVYKDIPMIHEEYIEQLENQLLLSQEGLL